jgi:ribonuclease HII
MFEFRPTRGDQFFMEGGSAQVCKERVQKYQMQRNDCQLLEKNDAAFNVLIAMREELDRYLHDSVSYLKKNIPSARENLHEENVFFYLDFIRQYEKKLPASKVADFDLLQKKVDQMRVRIENASIKYKPQRDQKMADVVRDSLSEIGLNYMVIGADHVRMVAEHLQDLPLIVMVPRALVKEVPTKKNEL